MPSQIIAILIPLEETCGSGRGSGRGDALSSALPGGGHSRASLAASSAPEDDRELGTAGKRPRLCPSCCCSCAVLGACSFDATHPFLSQPLLLIHTAGRGGSCVLRRGMTAWLGSSPW